MMKIKNHLGIMPALTLVSSHLAFCGDLIKEGIIGYKVGYAGSVTEFWKTFEHISTQLDSLVFNKLKQSENAYEICLAAYLAPYFNDKDFLLKAIKSKRRIAHGLGCIISEKFVGELAYGVICGSPENTRKPAMTKSERLSLAIRVVTDTNMAHLHFAAGQDFGELSGFYHGDGEGRMKLLSWMDSYTRGFDDFELGLMLVNCRSPLNIDFENILSDVGSFSKKSVEEKALFGDSHEEPQRQLLLRCIKSPEIPAATKRFLLEFLYSNTNSENNGTRIHKVVQASMIPDSIKIYDNTIYADYSNGKILYNRLNAINTGKEMHKNKKQIAAMLATGKSVLFLDIMGFMPSTLLESKYLRKLKAEYVSRTLQAHADETDSYFSYLRYWCRNIFIEKNGGEDFSKRLNAKRYHDMIFDKKTEAEIMKVLGI